MNLLSEATATEFSTERLVIKRGAPEFASQLYDAARESIDTVYPFLPWCHPEYAMADADDWLALCEKQWQSGENFAFCIFDAENRLVGGCGVNKLDGHPVANLGYWLRTSATGRGYATEATLGLAQFSFEQLGFKRLEIIMATHNEPSRQVAINAGADFEGRLRNRLEIHDQLYDAYLYSLIP